MSKFQKSEITEVEKKKFQIIRRLRRQGGDREEDRSGRFGERRHVVQVRRSPLHGRVRMDVLRRQARRHFQVCTH